MNAPSSQYDESARLRELRSFGILDSPREEEYDTLTEIAARLFETPIAMINFVDTDRVWCKSAVGLDIRSVERKGALCSYETSSINPLIVEDLRLDPRFSENRLVVSPPGVRFYAGAPILSRNNQTVGMFCVMDTEPRSMAQADVRILERFAWQVMSLLESRRHLATLTDQFRTVRSLQHDITHVSAQLYACEGH